jgi:hypothetical protein
MANIDKADASKGLYRKFKVERMDGRSGPGEKHEHCNYYVLDLDHDPHSAPALEAYAASCAETHPALSADLVTLADLLRRHFAGGTDER